MGFDLPSLAVLCGFGFGWVIWQSRCCNNNNMVVEEMGWLRSLKRERERERERFHEWVNWSWVGFLYDIFWL